MSRVLVLGNAGVDLSLAVPRLPRPGETLVAGGLSRAPGGKGLNQAVAAARAGADTWFMAAVGDDADGRFVAGALGGEGFGLLRLARAPFATDVSVVLVAADGENSIVTAGACAAALDAAAAAGFAGAAGAGDVLLLQGNLSAAATLAAARAGQARGAVVVLNTAPLLWAAGPVLRHCAGVVANQGEAEAVTGFGDERAAAALLAAGPAWAVVTLGAAGCLFADAGGVRRLSAVATEAVDSTGAGDTVCGVLAACLARGWATADAVAAGQRAATVTVGRRGAYAALPRRDELARIVGRG